ncbi:MAG: hypothetical protein Kow0090_21560 [Myxococcota bacterium]
MNRVAYRIFISALVASALFSAACDSEKNCVRGAARCGNDGKTIERCIELHSCEDADFFPCHPELAWEERRICSGMYPNCAEADGYAQCVGDVIGECNFEELQDGCKDDKTLIECIVFPGKGLISIAECPEGAFCQSLPEGQTQGRHNSFSGYTHQCGTESGEPKFE